MSKNIKFMLKEAANKQEISNLQEQILNNVDVTKIERQPKSVALPKKKFNFFPLLLAGLSTVVLVITLSISIGIMNSSNSNSPITPPSGPGAGEIPTEPEEPITYEDINMTTLATFYSTFTKNDAPNMINIVNTFNNISYVKVDGRTTENDKKLKPDMEESIVNDVNPYLYNIEEMLGLATTNVESKANTNQNYAFENVIEVTNQNYKYYIYYTEKLTEVKNVDASNYKYKADLTGKVVVGNDEYAFTGEKRIKNSNLIYTTNIVISENESVEVKETFPIKADFSINYGTNSKSAKHEFRYLYTNGENTKAFEIDQVYKNNKIDNVRFTANRNEINEFKMTIAKSKTNYITGDFDGRDKDSVEIAKTTNGYSYTFKNSGNSYNK